MNAKFSVYAMALLSSVASARDQSACDNRFGENLQIITEQITLGFGKTVADLEKGDFNGDGLKDKVVILKLNKKTKFNNAVTLLNPPAIWPEDRKPGDLPVNADKAPPSTKDTIALGIIQSEGSDKRCRKFVIYNTDYFPASEAKHLAVGVVSVGDKGYSYEDLQKLVTGDLRYDAIYLAPPMPIGIVYWSNGRYIFDLPYSDPERGDED